MRFHALMNEAQMLLHEHPVNAGREARGELALNSIWFWGGGVIDASKARPFSTVVGDDPLTRGLALAAGIPARALPKDAGSMLAGLGDEEWRWSSWTPRGGAASRAPHGTRARLVRAVPRRAALRPDRHAHTAPCRREPAPAGRDRTFGPALFLAAAEGAFGLCITDVTDHHPPGSLARTRPARARGLHPVLARVCAARGSAGAASSRTRSPASFRLPIS